MKTHPALTHENIIFFSDFDGTIILEDSTDTLVKLYGSEQDKLDEALFAQGKATHRDVMERHYRAMRPTPALFEAVMETMPLDPAFPMFYHAVRALGIEFYVLTGGAAEGVHGYLAKNGLGEVVVYGNSLYVDNHTLLMKCGDAAEETFCKKGLCGHCKTKHLEEARKQGKAVIYIGDGLTDLCAASHTDFLFAKDVLAHRCEKSGVPFMPFTGFCDIYRYFFQKNNAILRHNAVRKHSVAIPTAQD